MQDIRREKCIYAGPIYSSLPKPTKMPTQIIPRKKTSDSDIDSLEHKNRKGYEENPPHQEGIDI